MKDSNQIVVLDGATLNPGDLDWEPFRSLGEFRVHSHTPPERRIERARDATILLTNKVRLTRDILQNLPNLRFVSVIATGYDVIDVAAANDLGVVVSNVPPTPQIRSPNTCSH